MQDNCRRLLWKWSPLFRPESLMSVSRYLVHCSPTIECFVVKTTMAVERIATSILPSNLTPLPLLPTWTVAQGIRSDLAAPETWREPVLIDGWGTRHIIVAKASIHCHRYRPLYPRFRCQPPRRCGEGSKAGRSARWRCSPMRDTSSTPWTCPATVSRRHRSGHLKPELQVLLKLLKIDRPVVVSPSISGRTRCRF